MSYQVLARKWRPQNFAQLVGQEHVVTAISNALVNNRLHHAYLFTGTRGVGKTTIARIFSKSLNCETGMTAEPCGQCGTCQDIDQGRYIDLLEIDAASRTKVEDTRDLLDNVQYKPTRGEYKVYLIDEVHMLSKHSFNALLKTLEEPPPHVKFLLATTDPQKLPVTILSRCLQFNLKAMSREQITGQLQHILQQEQLPFDTPALAQLARAANGSMRDALSLTDQAIAQGNGHVSLDVVTTMLGLMDKNQVLKLLNAVLEGNSQESLAQLDALASQSVDYSQLLAELLSLLHQIALTQIVPDACKLETISAKAIYHLAQKVPPEHIQLQYQIVLQGRKDLAHAMDGRSGTEMTLLRMLAFNPQRQLASPADIANASLNVPETAIAASSSSEIAPAPESATATSAEATLGPDTQGQLAQELALQQAEIMQQAEAMQPSLNQHEALPSQADVEDTGSAEPASAEIPAAASDDLAQAPQTAHLTEAPEQSPSQLSQTESLLAMRRGLRQSKEEAQNVKKSESSAAVHDPIGSFVRARAAVPEQAPAIKEQPTVQGSDDLFSSPVEQVAAENPIAASTDNAQPVTSATDNQPASVEVGADTASELNPPWEMEEQHYAQQQSDDAPFVDETVLSPPEETITQVQPQQQTPAAAELESANEPQAEAEVVDDYADILAANVVETVEVNIEVPTFTAEGEKVIHSQQLDSWSRDIELSGVGGLTKQLALHSSMQRLQGQCKLTLLASQHHLNNEVAVPQLQQALSDLWQQPVELVVELGQPQNTPFGIQQSINAMRQQYAVDVIKNDENINLLQQQFEGQIVAGSIKAN
ncbi:DNA polymerase III subunit gamma/tau [Alteromonadaceae bacterium BrNp21-10]|nr:DNA polymerase III subunit gamma/tau [Alteromonadaceae bacterium BrNp21-10]